MNSRFERFSLALFNISRDWNRIASEEMKRYGLKGAYAIYLVTLAQYKGELTSAELCEKSGKDKGDVSRGISEMEQRGLVKRVGGNAYRAKLVLTEEGLEMAHQLEQRAASVVEYANGDSSEEDRAIFYNMLDNIMNNLHELTLKGIPENERKDCN